MLHTAFERLTKVGSVVVKVQFRVRARVCNDSLECYLFEHIR